MNIIYLKAMKTKTTNRLSSFLENSRHLQKLQRLALVLLFCAGLSATASAQHSIGIKTTIGGACQSEVLKISNDYNILFAYGIGVSDNLQLNNYLALQTGLEYLRKGFHQDEDNIDQSNAFHYLLVPVLAEFSASEKAGFNKGQRIYFGAGPYFAYLLDASSEVNGLDVNIDDETRNYDLGLRFTLGLEFPVLEKSKLRAGISYDMGFTEVYKDEHNMQNKLGAINLGFIF